MGAEPTLTRKTSARARIAIAVALGLAIGVPALASVLDAESESASAPEPYLDCTSESEATNFDTYSLGPSFEGLQATTVLRRCDPRYPGEPGRANYVSHIYGDCEAFEASCTAPLEVQSWRACERTLADYELSPGVPYPTRYVGEKRSVPVYSFEDGTRLELYTGESTVVIFGHDPERVERAVSELRKEPSDQEPAPPAAEPSESGDLADPAPGAMSGELSCSK